VIIFHFDALATKAPTFGQRQPSMEGRRLWNSFFHKYMGRVYLVADADDDIEMVKTWLKREGYKVSAIYQTTDLVRDGSTPRAEAVWAIASALGRPHFYIDTDPETCAYAVKQGITALLMAVPQFMRPEFHTPNSIRAWDTVVDELDAQALKKSERTWGDI
jgi:hypothetical protein